MKISKLIISKEIETLFPVKCEFAFDQSNVIFSNKNSVGKTTIIRFVLFSLGFKIPSTKFVNMMSYKTELFLSTGKKEYIVVRQGYYAQLFNNDHVLIKKYNLQTKDEMDSLIMFLFGLSNSKLVDSLLGTFYIDQDNGWDISNKGQIIQYNYFNVLDLVASFINESLAEVEEEITNVRQDISKYAALLNLLNADKREKDKQYFFNESIFDGGYKELKNKQSLLIAKKDRLQKSMYKLEMIIKDNSSLVENIENFNIIVSKNGGEPFILKRKDIYNFEINTDILLSQLNDLRAEYKEVSQSLRNINIEIKKATPLIGAKEVSDNAVASLREANISEENLKNIISELKQQLTKLRKQRETIIINNKDIYLELTSCIQKRIKDLGHSSLVANIDLLTTNMQLYFSGTELHDICFAYNLGCIDFIEKKTNIKVPIIIDSPGSGERTIDNLDDLMKYLLINYNDHQIIVSTAVKFSLDAFDLKTRVDGYFLDGYYSQYK